MTTAATSRTSTKTTTIRPSRAAIAAARRAIEAAQAAGGRVVRIQGVGTPEGIVPAVLVELPDYKAALRLLTSRAKQTARDPEVFDFARRVRAQYQTDERTARALHEWMLGNVTFAREPGEIFQGGSYTARTGVGDCDCQAILLSGLGAAAGLTTRLVPMRMPGEEPRHVAVQFRHGGEWHWAETTVPAHYGENPVVAAVRTKAAGRSDLGV